MREAANTLQEHICTIEFLERDIRVRGFHMAAKTRLIEERARAGAKPTHHVFFEMHRLDVSHHVAPVEKCLITHSAHAINMSHLSLVHEQCISRVELGLAASKGTRVFSRDRFILDSSSPSCRCRCVSLACTTLKQKSRLLFKKRHGKSVLCGKTKSNTVLLHKPSGFALGNSCMIIKSITPCSKITVHTFGHWEHKIWKNGQ